MDVADGDWTDTFEQLTDETRLEVLRTLAEAASANPDDPWLAYSELRDAVGVRDKGNFNYHLGRLDDLVVKGDAGYRLSRIGMELVSAVASGAFDPEWTWGPVEAPGTCFHCGGSLSLSYERGILRLSCGTPDHATPLSVPPSLLEAHPTEEVIERIAFVVSQWGATCRQGICTECQGHVEGTIEPREPSSDAYAFDGQCQRCGFRHGIPVGLYVLSHPAVVSFFYDHGVDVRRRPFWTLDVCRPDVGSVVATDPFRFEIEIFHDGARLSVGLNRDGAVVDTERQASPDGSEASSDADR